MMKYYVLLAFAVIVGFGASPTNAQVELSGGFGMYASRLTNWGSGGRNEFVGSRARNYAHPAVTVMAAYRPSARLGLRGVAGFSEREANPFLGGFRGGFTNPRARTVDVSLEAAYYPNGWWSIGVGGGYAFNSERYGEGGSNSVIFPQPDVFGSQAPPSFGFANLAFEFYTGAVTLRVAPSVSLGRVYPESNNVFSGLGEPLQSSRGSWFGLNAGLMVKAPFGKTRYSSPITFDSLLDRSVEPFVARVPLWGFGLTGSATGPVATVGANPRDGFSGAPAHQRLGLQLTYFFRRDWRLRGSIGVDRLRSYSKLDAEELVNSPQTEMTYNGLDLLLGVERRLRGDFYVAADFGPMNVFQDISSPRDGGAWGGPGRELRELPVQQVIWYNHTQMFWQGASRVRLGVQANLTLNNPYGSEPDLRLVPARRRDGRWLSVGASAAWMFLRA